jgi:phage gpG-like protein
MMTVALAGEDALRARFDALPAAMIEGLMAKASTLAQALADKVKDEKLSGGVLNAVSGALRASIVADAGVDDSGVFASVGSAGDVKYAAIQEYGGKTAAHEIVATKANALAFAIGGATIFAKRVMHPGSNIPERSYLRSSLAEMADEIVAALAEAPNEAWEGL